MVAGDGDSSKGNVAEGNHFLLRSGPQGLHRMYRTRECPAPQAHQQIDAGRPLDPGKEPGFARSWVTRREVNRSQACKGLTGASARVFGMTGSGGSRVSQET